MINDLTPRQIVKILETEADENRIRDFIYLFGFVSGHRTGNNPDDPKLLESFFDSATYCGHFRTGFHQAMESSRDFQEVHYSVTIYRDDIPGWESRYSERLVVDINEALDPILVQIGRHLSRVWPSAQEFSYLVHEYHIVRGKFYLRGKK
jgi:hypothetical protein